MRLLTGLSKSSLRRAPERTATRQRVSGRIAEKQIEGQLGAVAVKIANLGNGGDCKSEDFKAPTDALISQEQAGKLVGCAKLRTFWGLGWEQ